MGAWAPLRGADLLKTQPPALTKNQYCSIVGNTSVELEPIDRLHIVVRKLNSTPLGLYIIRWQRPNT
jgi:hypothetical protein